MTLERTNNLAKNNVLPNRQFMNENLINEKSCKLCNDKQENSRKNENSIFKFSRRAQYFSSVRFIHDLKNLFFKNHPTTSKQMQISASY